MRKSVFGEVCPAEGCRYNGFSLYGTSDIVCRFLVGEKEAGKHLVYLNAQKSLIAQKMGFIKMDELVERIQSTKESNKQEASIFGRRGYRSGRAPFRVAFPSILVLVLGTTYLIGRTLTVELEEEEDLKEKKRQVDAIRPLLNKDHSEESKPEKKLKLYEEKWKSFENKRVPRPSDQE